MDGSLAKLILALAAVGLVLIANTRSKSLAGLREISISPAVLLLPTVVALQVQLALWQSVVALLLVAFLARRELKPSGSHPRWWHVLILLATFGHVLLTPRSTGTLVVGLATLIVVVDVARRVPLERLAVSLLDGIALYCIVNVAGYAAGLTSPSAANRFGGLIGTTGGDRVFYPLTTSLNLAPSIAAIFVAAAPVLIATAGGRLLVLRAVGLACAVTMLFSAGARSALIISLSISLLSVLTPRVLRYVSVPVGIAGLLLAFVFQAVPAQTTESIVTAITGQTTELQRQGQNTESTLNGRTEIWQGVFDGLEGRSATRLALGYGTEGQVASGVSERYSNVFTSSTADPRRASAHNSGLQQLLDAGWVGLLGLTSLVALVLIGAARLPVHLRVVAVPATMAMALTGATEVTVAPGYAQEPMLFLVALFVGLACSARPPASDTIRGMSTTRSEADASLLDPASSGSRH